MQSKKEDGVSRGPGRLSGSSTVSEPQCKKWFSQGIYGKFQDIFSNLQFGNFQLRLKFNASRSLTVYPLWPLPNSTSQCSATRRPLSAQVSQQRTAFLHFTSSWKGLTFCQFLTKLAIKPTPFLCRSSLGSSLVSWLQQHCTLMSV